MLAARQSDLDRRWGFCDTPAANRRFGWPGQLVVWVTNGQEGLWRRKSLPQTPLVASQHRQQVVGATQRSIACVEIRLLDAFQVPPAWTLVRVHGREYQSMCARCFDGCGDLAGRRAGAPRRRRRLQRRPRRSRPVFGAAPRACSRARAAQTGDAATTRPEVATGAAKSGIKRTSWFSRGPRKPPRTISQYMAQERP